MIKSLASGTLAIPLKVREKKTCLITEIVTSNLDI